MRKAGLEEAQAGIKIAGRNINNLYTIQNFLYAFTPPPTPVHIILLLYLDNTREISITSDMQMTPHLRQEVKRN